MTNLMLVIHILRKICGCHVEGPFCDVVRHVARRHKNNKLRSLIESKVSIRLYMLNISYLNDFS